jgi:hypothetical protein
MYCWEKNEVGVDLGDYNMDIYRLELFFWCILVVPAPSLSLPTKSLWSRDPYLLSLGHNTYWHVIVYIWRNTSLWLKILLFLPISDAIFILQCYPLTERYVGDRPRQTRVWVGGNHRRLLIVKWCFGVHVIKGSWLRIVYIQVGW